MSSTTEDNSPKEILKAKQPAAKPKSLFGVDSMSVVISMIALCQGMNAIADLSISYLYKDDYHMGPVEVSFVGCLTSIPWLIKPLWGAISDNIPLFGYRRRSYLILLALLQCFYYVSLGTWIHEWRVGMVMLTLIQVSIAFNNVIGEALLVESAQEIQHQDDATEEQKQAKATKNVSLFFGVKYFGTLSTAYLGGFLLTYIDKHTIFVLTGCLPLLVVFAGLFIMKETVQKTPQGHQVPYQEIPDVGDVEEEALLCMEASTKDNAPIDEGGNWQKLVTFVSKPVILRPIAFLLLFMITPSSGSAMFYFYTNQLSFTPAFMGQLKFANSIASIIGVFFFNRFLKNVPFQKILFWSTLICVVLGSTQIILALRLNEGLGIPDKLFCVGDSIIIQTFGEINYLPILVLACRICPKNIEGTMYALLMSTVNLGGMISSQIGGALAYYLGITETNFDNLWLLILIANVSMLLPLPLLATIRFESAVEETSQSVSQPRTSLQDKSYESSTVEEKESLVQSQIQAQEA